MYLRSVSTLEPVFADVNTTDAPSSIVGAAHRILADAPAEKVVAVAHIE